MLLFFPEVARCRPQYESPILPGRMKGERRSSKGRHGYGHVEGGVRDAGMDVGEHGKRRAERNGSCVEPNYFGLWPGSEINNLVRCVCATSSTPEPGKWAKYILVEEGGLGEVG
jgi:hypothetical protein